MAFTDQTIALDILSDFSKENAKRFCFDSVRAYRPIMRAVTPVLNMAAWSNRPLSTRLDAAMPISVNPSRDSPIPLKPISVKLPARKLAIKGFSFTFGVFYYIFLRHL